MSSPATWCPVCFGFTNHTAEGVCCSCNTAPPAPEGEM